MLFLFVSFIFGEYVEISSINVKRIIGGTRAAFVKFYAFHDTRSLAMSKYFSKASLHFNDVVFGGVECNEQEEICQAYNITKTPEIYLFKAGERTGIPFVDPEMKDDYKGFLEKQLGITRLPSPQKRVIELKTTNLEQFENETRCGFVMFHVLYCPMCRHLIPQFRQLSAIYAYDTEVQIATLFCDQFHDICTRYRVPIEYDYQDASPILRMVINGVWSNYTGNYVLSSFVRTINRKCGVDRGLDGLLSDTAGTSAEADAIAKEFGQIGNQSELVERMRNVEGADSYVKAMERVLEKGVDQLTSDVRAMRTALDQRQGSMAALDALKKRYNAFVRFLPPPPKKNFSSKAKVKSEDL
jgi:thiol-disulfide isomerase/thioredoxin